MYRCLNVETLGITGRQSELLELALSNRFKGIELDMETLARQVDSRGQEYATRCIDSAKKCPVELVVGPWKVPVRWDAAEDRIKEQLRRVPTLANVAKTVDASLAFTSVLPGSESLPLKENFEFYSAKLTELSDMLAPHGIRLAIGFHAAAAAREGLPHQFVCKAEELITLVNMVNSDNVGLYLDTWNWHLGGGTMEMVEGLGINKLFAVSVADIPADADADGIALDQRMLPGPEGVIPIANMLERLHELEYDGPVTVYPTMSQYKGIPRDKVVVRVAEALRSVWPGAELQEEAEAEAAAAAEGNGAQAPKPAPAAEEKKEAAADGKESVATTS